MSNRKLQAEIDRTLKKVTEGLEIFHETLDKLNNAQTINQKEKFEIDLKKEIKKLQRLRDQIKNWQLLGEIKDKTSLNETRRLIELEMEKFKALEKEIKIKAYSKEGLTKESKVDPRERERQELVHWINNCVIQLNTQKDALEAEIEAINLQKGKDKQSKIAKSESKLERHKYHIKKLEVTLRMLENEQLSPEGVQNIKDDIDYYIEENGNDDFVENEEIYDDLNLPESQENVFDSKEDEDEQQQQQQYTPEEIKLIQKKYPTPSSSYQSLQTAATASTTATATTDKSLPSSSSVVATSKPHQPQHYHHHISSIQNLTPQNQGVTNINSSGSSTFVTKMSTPPKPIVIHHTSSSSSSTNKTFAAMGNSAAVPLTSVSGGTGGSSATNATTNTSSSSNPFNTVMGSSGSSTVGNFNNTFVGNSNISGINTTGTIGRHPPGTTKGPSFASAASANLSLNAFGLMNTGGGTSAVQPPPSSSSSISIPSSSVGATTGASAGSSVIASQININEMDPSTKVYFNITDSNIDSMFSELRAKAQSLRQSRLKDISNVINNSVQYCSDAYEVEKSRQFTPKQPYQSSSYYPTVIPPILENPSIFERFELDTLFFIFYYQQHTYAQYLAARELKRQSWRFHKKYLTWFQRHEEPKSINDEYEQGTYIYFDYEGSWCQRKKTEFTFEYRYLEDEDTV